MKIEGGTGNGYSVKVDSNNRLWVSAVTKSAEHISNHDFGRAFSINFIATPTGPGDCFLYIKNSAEIDLVIEDIWIYLPASEYFEVRLNNEGTPVGGTDISPVLLNTKSGYSVQGTFQSGNDITGLTTGDVAYRFQSIASSGTLHYNFEQDIILAKNGVCSIWVETGTTALNGFMNLNYHDKL